MEASVKTAREAVRVEKFIAPEELMPVRPEAAPVELTFQLLESIVIVLELPPIVTEPVEVPVLILVA